MKVKISLRRNIPWKNTLDKSKQVFQVCLGYPNGNIPGEGLIGKHQHADCKHDLIMILGESCDSSYYKKLQEGDVWMFSVTYQLMLPMSTTINIIKNERNNLNTFWRPTQLFLDVLGHWMFCLTLPTLAMSTSIIENERKISIQNGLFF